MTRTQNIKRNLTFNILKYVVQLVLQFVSRTVLIYVLGIEYTGLNGLFTNIFSLLNLVELGFGSAIVFSMYKPIADGDYDQVRTLQRLYKKFYLIIALFVLVVGGVLTPFLDKLIKGKSNVDINIYIVYIMYLLNAVIGYISADKKSLLSALQRNDIENKINTICIFVMTTLQVVVLLLFKNYYIYYSLTILSTLFECAILQLFTIKKYPFLKGKTIALEPSVKRGIAKNVAALSFHKIGTAAVFSTDNIIISAFCGLTILGYYSNYALIITSLNLVFSLITSSMQGSVGSLIASADREYVHRKFEQANLIFSMLCGFCTVCTFVLFQPFIKSWMPSDSYLLNFTTMTLICISFYLSKMRSCVLMFKDAAGLFWQDRWKPLVEALVNLLVSILLAIYIGLDGVIIGTIVSTLAAPFWVEPWMLYKHYFKLPIKNYFFKYIYSAIVTVVIAAISFAVCYFIPLGGVWLLILRFAVCIFVTSFLFVLAHCWRYEFKEIFKLYVKPVFSKIFKLGQEKIKE